MALCISVRQTNYSRATTLPRYGTRLSPNLAFLVRGASHYIRVCRTLEFGLTPNEGQHVTTAYPELPEDTWVLLSWRRSYT
jgi:hypothetical protein